MTARSALRRYALVCFLTWLPLGLMMPSAVLLMTERGLGLTEVGLVMTIFSVVTVTLELPTGGLADVLGRRVMVAVSAAFLTVALLLTSVAATFWAFLAAYVLKGVARALSSGPATAWYVDTLHRLEGPDADLKPGLSRGAAMESVSLCAGVLAGGALPVVVPVVVPPEVMFPLAAPALAGAVAAATLLVVVPAALPEPPHHHRRSLRDVLREVPFTVVTGVRLAAGGRVLRRMMLACAASGVMLTSIELLTPGRLAELAGTAEEGSSAYAVVAALGFAGSAAGSALAPLAARLAGSSAGGAIAGIVMSALAVATLAATAGLGGAAGLLTAATAYVTLFAGAGVAGLLCLEMTHREVSAAERTTVTSVSSISLQSGGVLANLTLAGLAAQAGVGTAWTATAAVVLASALLFVRMPATGSSRVPAPAAPACSD